MMVWTSLLRPPACPMKPSMPKSKCLGLKRTPQIAHTHILCSWLMLQFIIRGMGPNFSKASLAACQALQQQLGMMTGGSPGDGGRCLTFLVWNHSHLIDSVLPIYIYICP